ncbi:unnamed protein product [Meloidogyne enterolobii]|uniref:Uncharacterized protein n=1 Tax=Meloidogyne enterolobii TaxID=390850 RepID=A0ACB0Z415_MELEN
MLFFKFFYIFFRTKEKIIYSIKTPILFTTLNLTLTTKIIKINYYKNQLF